MDRSQKAFFFRQALSGQLSRREVLSLGLRLGIATPVIATLMSRAPEAMAAPAPALKALRSRDAEEDAGTVTALIISGTNDIDPHSNYTTIGSVVNLCAYEMLLRYKGDSTSEFEPMLAESWEVSDDQSTFTFKIPSGVVFHDGTPCDANAVKASMIRFRRLELGPYLVLARFCDDPENQIEVVDATTVRFNLGRPQPLFLAAMASSYGPYIVSPAAWEENKSDEDEWAHEWLSFNAVGTGPYRLIENTLNERILLERFDDYHRGWEGSHFSTVLFRIVAENSTRRELLEQGEADVSTYNLTPEDVEALESSDEVTVLKYPTTRVNWAILNVPLLKSVEARQALTLAFPYQAVIDGAYKGLLNRSGPIPSTVQGADPGVFLPETDLVKAKELLLKAGFAEGDTFTYQSIAEDEIEKTISQLFQANMAEMGLNLEIELVDNATQNDIIFSDSPAEEKPMIIGAWAWFPDYNDPWNQLAPNFLASATGGGGSNAGAWVNDRFEEIMAEAEQFTDQDQLDALMDEALMILTRDDPPAIFYGEAIYYTVLKSDIQGFVPNPLYLESYFFYDMSRSTEQ